MQLASSVTVSSPELMSPNSSLHHVHVCLHVSVNETSEMLRTINVNTAVLAESTSAKF